MEIANIKKQSINLKFKYIKIHPKILLEKINKLSRIKSMIKLAKLIKEFTKLLKKLDNLFKKQSKVVNKALKWPQKTQKIKADCKINKIEIINIYKSI